MATIRFGKLDNYMLKLHELKADTPKIAGKAIYAGADIVADQVKENLSKLDTVTDREGLAAAKKNMPTYLTESARLGLIDSFGITPMQKDKNGYYNVKLGFDGYNKVKTKKYPNGQPNQLIARACESGSTAMIKQPFMRDAVNKSRKKAEKKMAEVLAAEIKKKMEG